MPAKFDLTEHEEEEDVDIGYLTALTTYFGYGLLFALGHLRDFLVRCFRRKGVVDEDNGYAPFVSSFEDFYTRRLYKRIHDCWNRPVASCPAVWMDVLLRKPNADGSLALTGESRHCLNLGSYNYLGFGDPNSPTRDDVNAAVEKFGASTGSSRSAAGTTSLHKALEEMVAKYIGKEAALVYGMGFGTNSLGIPALIGGKRTLIISDANNHTSIVVGARTSGATIRVFSHNNTKHLEEVVRQAIVEGVPRQRCKWDKIFIVVEGIYSMEGEMCPLKEIVAIKKKYKCYLYVDEAHSIGALGPNGRGITEYSGVDTKDIDILMGTFTKSFGAVGGYIAASSQIIGHLRSGTAGYMYSQSISPPAVAQIISAMKIMTGEDGTHLGKEKLRSLRENANYFRRKLREMGCHVLGDEDSPIVPVMLYNAAKIPAFSRECFEKGLAVVVVGFPATQLLLSRTRFCISASHTRKDLDWALERIEVVAHELGIKYNKS